MLTGFSRGGVKYLVMQQPTIRHTPIIAFKPRDRLEAEYSPTEKQLSGPHILDYSQLSGPTIASHVWWDCPDAACLGSTGNERLDGCGSPFDWI